MSLKHVCFDQASGCLAMQQASSSQCRTDIYVEFFVIVVELILVFAPTMLMVYMLSIDPAFIKSWNQAGKKRFWIGKCVDGAIVFAGLIGILIVIIELFGCDQQLNLSIYGIYLDSDANDVNNVTEGNVTEDNITGGSSNHTNGTETAIGVCAAFDENNLLYTTVGGSLAIGVVIWHIW